MHWQSPALPIPQFLQADSIKAVREYDTDTQTAHYLLNATLTMQTEQQPCNGPYSVCKPLAW